MVQALDALPKELDLCVEDGKEKVNCKVWFEKSPPKQPETEKHVCIIKFTALFMVIRLKMEYLQ